LPAYTLLTVSAKTSANFKPIWTVADFADQLLSAMRNQFGGHAEITVVAR
jgi:6-phosphogluconate dehydrogenase (decarboxylating)